MITLVNIIAGFILTISCLGMIGIICVVIMEIKYWDVPTGGGGP